MAYVSDVDPFVRFVEALRPWLSHVAVVGGWAHRLHRVHPLAQPLEYPPLMTRDADIAVPVGAIPSGDDICERLLEAGFEEEFSRGHRPPVTRYQLGGETGGFYAEFLTPLVGSDHKRDGSPDVTIRIGGISAQKLRHLDLLLTAPWSVSLGPSNGFPFSSAADVRIPNPASYLAQKILIHSKRKPDERAKDVLYIHDTIETFGRSLSEVHREWTGNVKRVLNKKATRVVERAAEAMFAEVTDKHVESVRGYLRGRKGALSAGFRRATHPATHVTIVCPASLRGGWQDEFRKWLGEDATLLEGGSPTRAATIPSTGAMTMKPRTGRTRAS
ncbi:MAG: hypothetical protein LAO51_12315 [Acidobacteriia bacterium]|nr:hypothetical protein [Terriglobia bacterium]